MCLTKTPCLYPFECAFIRGEEMPIFVVRLRENDNRVLTRMSEAAQRKIGTHYNKVCSDCTDKKKKY